MTQMPKDGRSLDTLLSDLAIGIQTIPFNRLIGLQLEKVEQDHVLMRIDMKPELVGNFLHGILHGGVTASVFDMAGGTAVMTQMALAYPEKSAMELMKQFGLLATIDLQVSYLRPGKGERFIIKAWLTKQGNHVSFAQMELRDPTDTLIATGSGTYLLK